MRRHAQVTLFVIIGLVIIIVVGLSYLALSSIRSNANTPRNTATAITNNEVVQQYVQNCIDTNVHDEFDRLGKSGALPAIANTATLPPSPIANGADHYPSAIIGTGQESRRVLYGLVRKFDNGRRPLNYTSPRYPDDDAGTTIGIYNANTILLPGGDTFDLASDPSMDGYFGATMFPAICIANGSNAFNTQTPCKYYVGSPVGTKGPATQDELQQRLTQRIGACANTDLLQRASTGQITEVTSPNATVTFTPDVVIVSFSQNVTLRNVAVPVELHITKRYPIRYLAIATFAYDLAREESRNATFDLLHNYTTIPSYKDGMHVFKTNAVPTSSERYFTPLLNKASLVTITDDRSTLGSRSYSFSFLVEHRAPVLDVLASADECVISNERIDAAGHKKLVGIDPDDTPVTISRPTFTLGSPPNQQTFVNCTVTDEDGEKDWQVLQAP